MATLSTLPTVRATWGPSETLQLSPGDPGVLILHRRFMADPAFNQMIEGLITKGWVVISEIDDDPHNWKEFVESDFYAFRSVHAVTVSTDRLPRVILEWNQNVRVFGNAVFELPTREISIQAESGLVHIFFGALNRRKDWQLILEGIRQAANELRGEANWVVVHDRAFFESLPEGVGKTFVDTLPPQEYLKTLSSCDISLLPLADTAFNWLKSDIKLIESCAAGAVPVCSHVLYAELPEHRNVAVFATTPEQWYEAIVSLARDPTQRQTLAKRGLDYVKSQRMHSQQAQAREEYYRSLLASRAVLEAQRQARLLMLRST